VGDAPLVPGGFQDANLEKPFQKSGSTFSTQKKFSPKKISELKKKLKKLGLPPPLAFCFF